jgi:hypothetical protein
MMLSIQCHAARTTITLDEDEGVAAAEAARPAIGPRVRRRRQRPCGVVLDAALAAIATEPGATLTRTA